MHTVVIVIMLGFSVFLNTSCGKSKNVGKAEEYLAAGMYDEAIELLEMEVKAEPTNADAHYLLGEAYLFKGRESKAEASFKKAILLETAYKDKQGEAYYKVGMRKLEEGELRSSRELLLQAKKLKPELASEIAKWFYEKGKELADKGESAPRVIDYLSLSREWDPAYREEVADYSYKKATEMVEKEFYEDAGRYAQCSIGADPKHIDGVREMYASIAEKYIEREEVAQAKQYLNKLTQMKNSEKLVQELENKIGAIAKKKLDIMFVRIPAGSFLMGSENGAYDQKPVHQVTISRPFYLQKTEVTQGQWVAVMGNNPSHFNKGDDYPVEQVSWNDVQAFLQKLNAMDPGKNYRLPTEAEWEYACRAGTTGERYGELDDIAWYDGNSGGETHPVGKKQPNAWGLYDMLGNVWEWCQDWKDSYPTGSVTDPTGPLSGSWWVNRGGCWRDSAEGVRSADRVSGAPPHYAGLGFRLARGL